MASDLLGFKPRSVMDIGHTLDVRKIGVQQVINRNAVLLDQLGEIPEDIVHMPAIRVMARSPFREVIRLIILELEKHIIRREKHVERSQGRSLVTVAKTVVANQRMEKGRCFLREGRVNFVAEKSMEGPGASRLNQSFISIFLRANGFFAGLYGERNDIVVNVFDVGPAKAECQLFFGQTIQCRPVLAGSHYNRAIGGMTRGIGNLLLYFTSVLANAGGEFC